MEVFKYVEDKDVFQKFYSNMLARRLVSNASVSEDAEGQMISLLKGACGFEYTSKLQRMFHDMTTSRELCTRFNNWVEQKPDSNTLLHGGKSPTRESLIPTFRNFAFIPTLRVKAAAT